MREQLIARYERSVASARHAELREVQLRLRAQLDELLADVLRRSDRMVRPEQLRRLVAVVDGAVVAALTEMDPDPRRMARGALLEVINIVAPPVRASGSEAAARVTTDGTLAPQQMQTPQQVDRFRALD